MAPQHVEISETIVALRRALKREKEAPSSQPIQSATNRGNKLKRGANYVHSGSLPYKYLSSGYKEKIEHAGYTRYIVNRNPKRYNEYGFEIDESESDEDADADAEDENPYSEVRLEELLRPLTHPAELANHPTMSLPFLDPAISQMVRTTEEQLRRERASLWKTKYLYRFFIGDESWMPCETVEAAEDWDLFEPHQESNEESPRKKRRRDMNMSIIQNGVDQHDHAGTEKQADEQNFSEQEERRTVNEEQPITDMTDVVMDDAVIPITNGHHSESPKADPDQMSIRSLPNEGAGQGAAQGVQSTQLELDERPIQDNGDELSHSQTPPPPRRITRALAAGTTNSNAPTPPLSPATTTSSAVSSSLLQPAPLFLLPPSLYAAHSTHQSSLPLSVAHSGLPVDELLDTRRIICMYIQKQEETIRGLEAVLGKLIKAKRMRDHVFEWSKIEGHVGEWSDGEDWIDTEAWGVKEGELRKGRDEEENQEEEVGRKGKRRRARE